MKTMTLKLATLLFLAATFLPVQAQKHPDMEMVKQVETTPVKNQQRTGTCWSYATISFIETEVLRMTGNELNLSEMFPVYYAYQQKAKDYVRYHGTNNFSQGGQAHDVMHVFRKQGIVPASAYAGKEYAFNMHDHSEMEAMLKNMLEPLTQSRDKLTQVWDKAVVAVLNTYMGKTPDTFNYKGKEYTPKRFAEEMAPINPDDYVELTSYSHHPYYKAFDLEVPDNWSHDRYYNLKPDELMEIMKHALKNGYSVDWDGDVSEDMFDHSKAGKAALTDADANALKEHGLKKYRQITFNNRQSTDDHLMHLTGLAENKDGKLFFQTKNSWDQRSNEYDGFLYMAEDYVGVKTIAIMVHKDAIPEKIADKLW